MGAKRKSGRCELAVTLIYLTFLNWWGCTTLERIGQTRIRKWPYHFEEVLVWYFLGTAFPRVCQESLMRWKLLFLKAVEGKAPNVKKRGKALVCAEGRFLAGDQTCVCLQHRYRLHWNRIAKKLCANCVWGGGVATWEYFIWVILMRMKCFMFLFLKWHFSYLRRYNGFSVLLLKFDSTLKSWNQSFTFLLGQNISAAFVSRTVMVVVAFHCNKMKKKNKGSCLRWDLYVGKKASLEPLSLWVSISFAPWAGSTWR